MIARRSSPWQQLVALAPLLLVALHFPGGLMMRCRIDGVLRPARCCPDLTQPRDAGPAVKGQACCDPERAERRAPPYEAVRATDDEQAASLAASQPCAGGVGPVVASADVRLWSSRRDDSAREGPSIVLRKHAFLI